MPMNSIVSQVIFNASNLVWQGTAKCNGALVQTSTDFGESLRVLTNYAYGGTQGVNVAVPDLRTATPVTASDETSIGTTVPLADGTGTRSLGLSALIYKEGQWAYPTTPPDGTYIGEILFLACEPRHIVSDDLLLCDGRLVSITIYEYLYNVIGTTYGGDGISTFALPDLRHALVQRPLSGGVHGAVEGEGSTSTLALTAVIAANGVYPVPY